GRIQASVDALRAALEELPDDAPGPIRARVLVDLSRALMRNSEPAAAIRVADDGLAIAERLDLLEVLADGYNNKAASLSYLGRGRESVALMELALRVARDGGFVAQELRARTNLASVTVGSDPRRGMALFDEAAALAERLG